jgi:uncharacterized protein YidB (DUF937 family)
MRIFGEMMMTNQWGQGAGGGLGDLLGAMMGGGSADGLASLVGKLQKGGLGAEVESWVGSGENISVAPEKLAQALGRDELAGMAQQFGGGAASGGAMAVILAQLLPAVINGMTPQGRLPQSQADMGGGLDDVLGSVLSGMMGGQPQQQQGGLGDVLGGLMGAMSGGSAQPQAGGGLGGLLGTLLAGAGAATAAGMAGKGEKVLPPGDDLPAKPAALGGGGKGGSGGGFRDNDVDPRNPLGDPGGLFRRR